MGEIRFALLGPLRAWRGEEELTLGPKQQRLILALLLARGGEWVSTAELIDILWGDAPPESAVNATHRYIGALRRMLEPGLPRRATGAWLLGEAGQYRLRVGPQSLDLAQFRHEMTRSRQAAAQGRRGEALERAARVLALWQDRCAAGLDPALTTHPVFAALEDECSQAVRETADWALAENHPSAVLMAARRSADRNPLDEAMHAKLMTLLAADGRTAEAIRVYQNAKHRLDTELGVEPGPELETALHNLTHQPDETTFLRPTVRPAQLPSDHGRFFGRDREAEQIRHHAQASSGIVPVIGIDGIPGVGKSTLAIHVSHQLAPRYPDGQLYLNLRGFDARLAPAEPAEALQILLAGLGVAAKVTDDDATLAAMLRSTLADRRVLILLDNAADAEQIRPLLPGGPGCLVIITSRTRLTPLAVTAGAKLITLSIPQLSEARAAFLADPGSWDDADPAELDEIIERCGRLPLAMALVGARIHGLPTSAVLDDLRHAHNNLDAFTDANLNNSLRAVFSWSYQRLSPQAARLFRAMSVHPGPDFTIEAMAAALATGETAMRHLIGELLRTRLITQHRPHRYQMHLLSAAYATELATKLDRPAEIAAIRSRLYDLYKDGLEQAMTRVQQARKVEEAMAAGAMPWLLAELDVVQALIEDAAARGESGRVWRLTLGLQNFYHRTNRVLQWRDATRFALDVAVAAGDREGRAQMHRSLAGAYFVARDYDTALAHLVSAQQLFEELDLQPQRALALANEARIWCVRRRIDRVSALYRQALPLLHRYGLHRAHANLLQAIALEYVDRHPNSAIMLARRAEAIFEKQGDVRGMGISDHVYSQAALAQGRLDEALEFAKRALSHLTQHERYSQAAVHATLGDIMTAYGRHDEAREAWLEGLTFCDDMDVDIAHHLLARLHSTARPGPD
ncbi:BTAD domain-containing putative transcriptional regulator [Actinoplanes sp. NPDC049596]|uniref:AfsR/SARP family transcriptional regulator n=1 Tax=unclassified Actinoplanes TaxID=2626549 RepID=UPI003421409B